MQKSNGFKSTQNIQNLSLMDDKFYINKKKSSNCTDELDYNIQITNDQDKLNKDHDYLVKDEINQSDSSEIKSQK